MELVGFNKTHDLRLESLLTAPRFPSEIVINTAQTHRVNKNLKRIEIKADDIIYQSLEQGHDLTITEFKSRYNGGENKRILVKEFLRMHIQRLKESNKYGNTRVFRILNGSSLFLLLYCFFYFL